MCLKVLCPTAPLTHATDLCSIDSIDKANSIFAMHQIPAKKPTIAIWVTIIVATSLIYLGSWVPVKAFYDAKYPTDPFPRLLKTFYGPAAWVSGKPSFKQPLRAYWIWCYEMFGGKL
tara:strand:+ start:60 stop:410 length:351 start_codon:yes stop_codon:yes gene_type:complete